MSAFNQDPSTCELNSCIGFKLHQPTNGTRAPNNIKRSQHPSNLATTVPSPQHTIQSPNPRENSRRVSSSLALLRDHQKLITQRAARFSIVTAYEPHPAVPFPRCPLPLPPNQATHLSNPAPTVSKPREFPRGAALRRSSNFRASARRNGSRRRELGLGSPGRAWRMSRAPWRACPRTRQPPPFLYSIRRPEPPLGSKPKRATRTRGRKLGERRKEISAGLCERKMGSPV